MDTSEEQLSSQSTTASDRDRREQFIDGLATVNSDANELDRITPVMALKLINSYRHITTNIGCWESGLKPCHKAGYTRVNLRNTFVGNSNLNVRPLLYQIALIATDRYGHLTATLAVVAGRIMSPICAITPNASIRSM
ncbi:uncharacterized protein V1513DRAFT_286700 [Lipomyces chichibuensis]|uniref:uncharacterized protein n=1 Tax=Lipomyces chichibuensis TaxID=1546026 RepID=UPI0033430DAB